MPASFLSKKTVKSPESQHFQAKSGCGGRVDAYSALDLYMSRFEPYERGGNMNKNELVSAVAEKSGLSKTDAASAVDAVFETIQGELKSGGDVRLVGFGNFSVSRREASKGRNLSTGAEIDIPARNVPKFSAGKGLKDAVNG